MLSDHLLSRVPRTLSARPPGRQENFAVPTITASGGIRGGWDSTGPNYYVPMDRPAPQAPGHDAPSPSLAVPGWDEQLRARGYRVTPQRQLVLEAVARLDHATPEEIGAQVQQTARGVNISTIYRTLELLEQIGMVTHTHLGHGAPIYHLATDA